MQAGVPAFRADEFAFGHLYSHTLEPAEHPREVAALEAAHALRKPELLGHLLYLVVVCDQLAYFSFATA